MSNIAFGFPNRIASATLYGQGFVSTLPLWHLTTRKISQRARSTTVPAMTVFAQFATAAEAGIVALAGHNLTTAGLVRVRGYSSDPRPYVDRSTQAATLDLPFDRNLIPAGLVCTRASSATYFDSAGVLQTAANDVARITHDPATLQCLGLLVESAATNLALHCRDLTQGAWTRTNATVTKTATGLDGVSNSASRVTATASNATVTQAITSAASHAVCFWMRRVSGSGGVVITADNFGATTSATLTSAWQRFVVSGGGGTDPTIGVRLATSGDVIEVDFAQCEVTNSASIASSPIATAGTAATRQADAISYPIPSGVRPRLDTGTLVATFVLQRVNDASIGAMVTLASAAGTSSANVRVSSTTAISVDYIHLSSTQADLSLGFQTVGVETSVAMSWAANSIKGCRAAGAVSTDTSATVLADVATALSFAAPAGALYTLRRLSVLPAASADADLQSLTTAWSLPAAGYDSGNVLAWPAEWTSGTTAEQRAGARALALVQPTAPQTYAWWQFDISDPSNPAGWVELARVFVGSKWRPEFGAVYGASIGYVPRASSVEADSGAEDFVARPNPRIVKFNLEGVSETECLERWLEMHRQLGTTEELLFLWDPADARYAPVRSFMGRMTKLDPPVCIAYRLWSAPCEIKELL